MWCRRIRAFVAQPVSGETEALDIGLSRTFAGDPDQELGVGRVKDGTGPYERAGQLVESLAQSIDENVHLPNKNINFEVDFPLSDSDKLLGKHLVLESDLEVIERCIYGLHVVLE